MNFNLTDQEDQRLALSLMPTVLRDEDEFARQFDEKLASYPDGNPKTLMGAKKPDPSVIPPIAILHLATAMMNGAEKYGPFNWRDQPISVRPYVAAALRHLLAFLDGEDYSTDTLETGHPVHHLGHVMACCAIVLDAMSVGTISDNRPAVKGVTGEAIERYNEVKRLAA